MLAKAGCFSSGSCPLLLAWGWERFWRGRGFECFSSLIGFCLIYFRETPAHICLLSASRSASPPLLDAWDPRPVLVGRASRRTLYFAKKEKPGVVRGGQLRGARCFCFYWISALLSLDCWPFRESFGALKALSWHVPPLIPASRMILSSE